MNQRQADNFWERNQAFMTEKEDRKKKIEQKHRKDFTFQPKILPKSRELTRSASRSSQLKVLKPWDNKS